MIWTIVQTSWRRLRNNKSELILTFVVPIIFFSIFAVIFGSRDTASTTPKIRVALSIESPESNEVHPTVQHSIRSIIADLRKQAALRFTQEVDTKGELAALSRPQLADQVERGKISAGVVLQVSRSGDRIERVEILTDSYDQVASQILSSLVQRSVFSSIPTGLPSGIAAGMPAGGLHGMSPAASPALSSSAPPLSGPLTHPLPEIATIDVLGGKKANPTIAMYAAGIAVMFLLFSATSNSGSLLDEKENSTLDRLLCSQLNMDQLLMGKWLFLTMIGCLQLFLMFVWGAAVFNIEVLRNWQGAVAMSVVTAGAASSFALLLATLCSSRTQLSWVSTIVILSMSALGGSMIPRYLMSETIQKFGLITFNAWALDGFNKVFWRELPLEHIGLELGVLAGCAGLFIVLARLFAVRWERT